MSNSSRSASTNSELNNRSAAAKSTTSTMKSSLFSGNSRRNNNNTSPNGNNNNNNNNNNDTKEQDVNEVLQENDAMLNALGNITGKMHSEAGRLRGEAKEHNQIVEQLLKGIGSASNSVRGTVTKIDQVMAKHGCSGTFVLAGVVFLIFVAFYYVSRYAWEASKATTQAPTPMPPTPRP